MKTWVATCAAIAALGMGSAAMAQSAMSGDAMKGSMAMMPTMVCRAAAKGEMPNAKTMAGAEMVCKKVDMSKMTAEQQKMIMENLAIPPSSGENVPIQSH